MSVPTFKSSIRLYGLFRNGSGEQTGQMAFVAHSRRLLEAEQRLIPMGWLAQAHIGEWTSAHYLAWGQQLPQQLQACYDRAGLRDYNAQLNEWGRCLCCRDALACR